MGDTTCNSAPLRTSTINNYSLRSLVQEVSHPLQKITWYTYHMHIPQVYAPIYDEAHCQKLFYDLNKWYLHQIHYRQNGANHEGYVYLSDRTGPDWRYKIRTGPDLLSAHVLAIIYIICHLRIPIHSVNTWTRMSEQSSLEMDARVSPLYVREENVNPEEAAELLCSPSSEVLNKMISIPAPCKPKVGEAYLSARFNSLC